MELKAGAIECGGNVDVDRAVDQVAAVVERALGLHEDLREESELECLNRCEMHRSHACTMPQHPMSVLSSSC